MTLYVRISLFDPDVGFFLSFSYFFFLLEIILSLVYKMFGELILLVCQCFDSNQFLNYF